MVRYEYTETDMHKIYSSPSYIVGRLSLSIYIYIYHLVIMEDIKTNSTQIGEVSWFFEVIRYMLFAPLHRHV